MTTGLRTIAILMAIGLPLQQAKAVTICGATVSALSLGTYDFIASTPTTTTATIVLTCVVVLGTTANWTITLSAGGGSFANRTMSSGASTLAYQVYTDSAHSQIWGDGTSGTSFDSGSYNAALIGGTTVNYTVYGQISARQTPFVGSYADMLVLTVTY